ncbi:MAG TPA: hypothetical protein VIO11_10225, partial [Candidatus Methanoperedens sp.]
MNAIESVRKLMGWCPQKKIVSNAGNVFISGYANCSKNGAFDGQYVESMEIPIQSRLELRIFAILLGFIALVLIGSERAGTYGYVLPSFFIYTALVIIFSHSKISVGNGALKISTPLSKGILIPENTINKVEIIENSAGRNK